MALKDKAILVDWSTGMWGASVTDPDISRDVNQQKHSAEDAGKWIKQLAPKDWLDKQRAVKAKAKKLQDMYTVPWLRAGQSVLPNRAYHKYDPGMTACRIEWYDVLNSHTLPEYEKLLRVAPIRMGDSYNPADFPTPQQMEKKFYFRYLTLPIPDTENWLTHLVNGDDARVKRELDERIEETEKQIKRELWKRLYVPVAALVGKLEKFRPEHGQRFHESFVGNIVEIVELLPILNIGDDKELENMLMEVKRKLTRFSTEELKQEEIVRDAVLEKAKDIKQRMMWYIGNPDDND